MTKATAFVYPDVEREPFLRRTEAIARALDLSMEVLPGENADFQNTDAALVAVPHGKLAFKLANTPLPYDLFVVGSGQTYIGENRPGSAYMRTAGDRLRVGYGKLVVYMGAAADAGTADAFRARAKELKVAGVDVVGGGDEMEALPSKTFDVDGVAYLELDRDALIARRPKVAFIEELAHANVAGSPAPKRYFDVLAILRAGIDVVTTLGVTQLEGLTDTVRLITGTAAPEMLPDGVLALANDVVFVDSATATPAESALRELAAREADRAKRHERIASPFERILLALGSRDLDLPMIPRAGRIAARLAIEFVIAHIVETNERIDPSIVEKLQAQARKANTEWIEEAAQDVTARLLEISRTKPETTIALAATRRPARLLGRPSFARRLLDAGARELLVLAPPA